MRGLGTPPTGKPRTVVYAGSFDPITNGHLDIIERAASLFDQTIVAIGRNPSRTPVFTVDERLGLLRHVTAHLASVEVSSFDGLLVDYCRGVGAAAIVRGLRAVTDFEQELQMAHANANLAPSIDTVFLPTRTPHSFVSASLVREIASYGGDGSRYVPPVVWDALVRKQNRG